MNAIWGYLRLGSESFCATIAHQPIDRQFNNPRPELTKDVPETPLLPTTSLGGVKANEFMERRSADMLAVKTQDSIRYPQQDADRAHREAVFSSYTG